MIYNEKLSDLILNFITKLPLRLDTDLVIASYLASEVSSNDTNSSLKSSRHKNNVMEYESTKNLPKTVNDLIVDNRKVGVLVSFENNSVFRGDNLGFHLKQVYKIRTDEDNSTVVVKIGKKSLKCLFYQFM